MISKPPILFHLLGLQDDETELNPLGLLAASTAAICATCVYLIIRILKDRQGNLEKSPAVMGRNMLGITGKLYSRYSWTLQLMFVIG